MARRGETRHPGCHLALFSMTALRTTSGPPGKGLKRGRGGIVNTLLKSDTLHTEGRQTPVGTVLVQMPDGTASALTKR